MTAKLPRNQDCRGCARFRTLLTVLFVLVSAIYLAINRLIILYWQLMSSRSIIVISLHQKYRVYRNIFSIGSGSFPSSYFSCYFNYLLLCFSSAIHIYICVYTCVRVSVYLCVRVSICISCRIIQKFYCIYSKLVLLHHLTLT